MDLNDLTLTKQHWDNASYNKILLTVDNYFAQRETMLKKYMNNAIMFCGNQTVPCMEYMPEYCIKTTPGREFLDGIEEDSQTKVDEHGNEYYEVVSISF